MRKLAPVFLVLAVATCKADGDESDDTGTETGESGDGSGDGDGGTGGDGGDGGGEGGACVPGQSIACACPNGDTGAQVCNEDGASYGPCICEDDGGGDDGGTGGDGGTDGEGGLPNGSPCETNDECESGYCWSDWNEQQHEPEPAECKPECIPDWDQGAFCDEDDDCCNGDCIMEGQQQGFCRS
jgi:hypothetical protein